MATEYDTLLDGFMGTPRQQQDLATSLSLDAIRGRLEAGDAFRGSVPPPGAAERDVANLIFTSRVGGTPGSGSNLLRSRQGAADANRIRLQNRQLSAQALDAASRADFEAAQLGQTLANRPFEEIRFIDETIATMRGGGQSELDIARFLDNQALVLQTDAGKAYAKFLRAKIVEDARPRGVTPIGFDPQEGISRLQQEFQSALGDPV